MAVSIQQTKDAIILFLTFKP